MSVHWYRTWPKSIASAFRPGQYVITGETEQDTLLARWRELSEGWDDLRSNRAIATAVGLTSFERLVGIVSAGQQ